MKTKIFFILLFLPIIIIAQTQLGQDIDGVVENDELGWSISLNSDGSIVAIGASGNDGSGKSSGYVQVHKYNNGLWTQIGNTIIGEVENNEYGHSVSISSDGSILAVATIGGINNSFTYFRVYKYNNDKWIQLGNTLKDHSPDELVSVSLSSDGSILAIGFPYINSDDLVSVYKYDNDEWVQLGKNGIKYMTDNEYGSTISLNSNGSILAVGIVDNRENGDFLGLVRVYKYGNSNWTQIGNNIKSEEGYGDEFKSSVSLSSNGNVLAIGFPFINDLSSYVQVYEYNNGDWIQLGENINGGDEGLGNSVSLNSDGSILAVGIPFNGTNGDFSGQVRIYKYDGNWQQVGNTINGETEYDESGTSVSLSSNGRIVAIGAFLNGEFTGQVRVYDLSTVLESDSYVLTHLTIRPNPTTHQIIVKLPTQLILAEVKLYNSLGQCVITTSQEIVNVSTLANGIYYVEVHTDKGKATKKIIVN